MTIQLKQKDLINTQQMEVTVNGPDGATHLILCTGVAVLGFVRDESYTFFVGPKISRRQFVEAIASGAMATIQTHNEKYPDKTTDIKLEANLVFMSAHFDDKSGQVKVTAKVSTNTAITNLAICYNVNILAELPNV